MQRLKEGLLSQYQQNLTASAKSSSHQTTEKLAAFVVRINLRCLAQKGSATIPAGQKVTKKIVNESILESSGAKRESVLLICLDTSVVAVVEDSVPLHDQPPVLPQELTVWAGVVPFCNR